MQSRSPRAGEGEDSDLEWGSSGGEAFLCLWLDGIFSLQGVLKRVASFKCDFW